MLLKARLQRGSHTRTLKLGRNHEGHLSEIGRGVQPIARAPNDLFVLTWSGNGYDRHVSLVVYVAKRLQLRVGKRAYAPEEPCVDVVLRKAMKQSLQRPRVGGASRTNHNLGAVLQCDVPLLVNGISDLGGEILVAPHVAQFFGCFKQLFTPTWMRDFDQCEGSLANRFAEQVRNTVLGDYIVRVRSCDPHPIASL